MVVGRRKHGDTMTCLQNNLRIFKIEGPRPLWLGPGENLVGIFPGQADVKTNGRTEGHDGGGVPGQEQDRTAPLFYIVRPTGLSQVISLPPPLSWSSPQQIRAVPRG